MGFGYTDANVGDFNQYPDDASGQDVQPYDQYSDGYQNQQQNANMMYQPASPSQQDAAHHYDDFEFQDEAYNVQN